VSISIVQRIVKTNLSHAEKAVTIAFALHLQEKNPERGAWVGVPTLAKETALGVRTVERAMCDLRKKGVLKRAGYQQGKSAKMPIYTVHPANAQETASVTDSSGDESATRDENPPFQEEESAKQGQRIRQSLADEQENKTINKKERTRQSSLSSDSKPEGPSVKRTEPDEFFLWLAENVEGLNLSSKERKIVAAIVPKHAMDVLTLAAQRALTGLDTTNTFDHCGDKLAANLDTHCRVIEKSRVDKAAQDALHERQKVQIRSERDAMLTQIAVEQAAEAEMIEVTLG
jgi:hypothetical protein